MGRGSLEKDQTRRRASEHASLASRAVLTNTLLEHFYRGNTAFGWSDQLLNVGGLARGRRIRARHRGAECL